METALAIGGCLLALLLVNLLGNVIAQLMYPTRQTDDDGRRFIYRLVFCLVMFAMFMGVYGGGAALGYWSL
ncbi:MAG TPA: hypothetical protein VGB08_06155 [Allosphingosinicella sp.]|jgi:hypothetical protein